MSPDASLLAALAAKNPDAEYFALKPNSLFSPELRQVLRFVRFKAAIPCVFCGKKRKKHWTMNVPFGPVGPGISGMNEPDRSVFPLYPVCQDHMLKPCFVIVLVPEFEGRPS